MSFKAIVESTPFFSIFSSDGRLVQWSGTKISNFIEGNKMIISVKLF